MAKKESKGGSGPAAYSDRSITKKSPTPPVKEGKVARTASSGQFTASARSKETMERTVEKYAKAMKNLAKR